MDMYAKMHKLREAQTIFQKYRNGDDNHPHAILIKAYSNCNRPERAEQLVKKMLQSEIQRDMVDIEIINCVLCAWAECTTSNPTYTADRVHQIYRWIYDHPIVAKMKILPNFATYSILFDCMAKAGSIRSYADNDRINPRNKVITNGIVSKVETLLNDIESRYLIYGDTNVKPDVSLYNCAIQACLNCKEYNQAEYILQLMEHRMSKQQQMPLDTQKIRVIPDTGTYCLFLNCYSKLGTVTGAEWTEQLHNHMCKLSQSGYPMLKPTTSTYNFVISAWAASDVPDVADRVWKVYEQMQADKIELDVYNYTTFISALSKSKSSIGIQRSIELLQIMQTKAKSSPNQSKLHPDGRHYCMVLNACVDISDIDNAAFVMNMFIDAYLMKRCRSKDRPDRSIFHWIISTWIRRNELTLASWFMFDTVTAVLKANNVPVSVKDTTAPNTYFATPVICRMVKAIGVDPAITSKLRSAWRESLLSQHLIEKEKYLTKIKTMITDPLFESQRQQYHKRFQRPEADVSSSNGKTTNSTSHSNKM
jgi:pentatricopeptide repeat protein